MNPVFLQIKKNNAMWQRIQTIYFSSSLLALIAASFSSLFYREYGSKQEFVQLFATHFQYVRIVEGENNNISQPTLLLAILVCFSILGTAAVIYFFKNRKIQIKISGWILIIQLLLLVSVIGYWMLSLQSDVEHIRMDKLTKNHPDMGTFFLVVSLISLFLGRRNVQKDEALVRSIDRIR
jgi:hypothetical protein